MEADKVPPGVAGPDRNYADMERSRFKRPGDVRRHVPACKERLRVTGRHQVQLAVVVQFADPIQRVARSRGAECKRLLELVALRFRRPATGQQSVCMLPCHAELAGQVGDRQTLALQECLPNVGFIPHGDDRNPYSQALRAGLQRENTCAAASSSTVEWIRASDAW